MVPLSLCRHRFGRLHLLGMVVLGNRHCVCSRRSNCTFCLKPCSAGGDLQAQTFAHVCRFVMVGCAGNRLGAVCLGSIGACRRIQKPEQSRRVPHDWPDLGRLLCCPYCSDVSDSSVKGLAWWPYYACRAVLRDGSHERFLPLFARIGKERNSQREGDVLCADG